MKIKDLLGEAEAQAVIKDYKPGQSLSMVDPVTDTLTMVDLKKNPTAVGTDEEGKLKYDPTPDAGAATPGATPTVPKPGDKVSIDVSATEGQDDQIDNMFDKWMNSEYAPMDDDSGNDEAVFIKALNFAADSMDNRSDSESLAYKLADRFHGSGMPDDEQTDVIDRLDESAYITALAKRVSGTNVAEKTKSNKDVFDIKRLAGL